MAEAPSSTAVIDGFRGGAGEHGFQLRARGTYWRDGRSVKGGGAKASTRSPRGRRPLEAAASQTPSIFPRACARTTLPPSPGATRCRRCVSLLPPLWPSPSPALARRRPSCPTASMRRHNSLLRSTASAVSTSIASARASRPSSSKQAPAKHGHLALRPGGDRQAHARLRL
jgi:hypothetical protein